jgi:DNA polymerase I-like protein with 3'-5' exonuclease and polymerase domains
MKRVFYTSNSHYYSDSTFINAGVQVYSFENSHRRSFHKWIEESDAIAYDIETVGDQFGGTIVLHSFCDGKMNICFDGFTYDLRFISMVYDPNRGHFVAQNMWKNTIMIAHNAQYELKWMDAQHMSLNTKSRGDWALPRRSYCTMIAEQKLLQGLSGTSVRFGIVDTLQRRGIPKPVHMDKLVRADFKEGYHTHTVDHVLYNMSDTEALHHLMFKQLPLIAKAGLNFHVHQIHMPLVSILAQMENHGWDLDEKSFLTLADKAEAKMKELARLMDAWVLNHYGIHTKNLNPDHVNKLAAAENRMVKNADATEKVRKKILEMKANNKTHLASFHTLVQRAMRLKTQINLDTTTISDMKVDPKKGLNWSSTPQCVALLHAIHMSPLPMAKSMTTKKMQTSVSNAAREKWLLENKNNSGYELIQLLDEYISYSKHVSSFGRGFVEKYKNPATGRFHTTYKQGTVATGRLSSGDASSDRFNSQQIPALPEIRNCFKAITRDYLIATVDLSGAELVTMCSLAKDANLKHIHENEDMHSYFANKGWQAIHDNRGVEYKKEDHISKKKNKQKRTDYKPMMFGTVYGLFAKKAAETLNVSNVEGQIAIDTILKEVPDVIKMVEEASAFAKANGYVVHNNRTNSRRWFMAIRDSFEPRNHVPKKLINQALSAARNTRIQGTQADMLNEAMVWLDRYIKRYKLRARIMMQVHDELVVEFHKEYKDWFPERISQIMTRTADKYLDEFVTMKADADVMDSWTK